MRALSAHTPVYNVCQLNITAWLRKELGLAVDAPVYFDDADLVFIDVTVLHSVLVHPTARLGRLRTALRKHIAALQ